MRDAGDQHFLHFTKKERSGIFVWLLLVIFIKFLPAIIDHFKGPRIYQHSSYAEALASLENIAEGDSNQTRYSNKATYKKAGHYSYKEDELPASLFYFDPNAATAEEWHQLGIRDKTIQTILHYREKGGRFRQAEDLGKIWGIHEDQLKRLIPYVRISAAASADPPKWNKPREAAAYPARKISKVDINTDDLQAWIDLPGIGEKLADRIVRFKQKLGGFHQIDQVAETFGLPDSTFQKIKPRLEMQSAELKKININTASVDEMKTHPYIRYQLANLIFQYRMQHGLYQQVEDLKKIMVITEEQYRKIAPYVSIN